MKYFNVHTHRAARDNELTIRVCGLHPWHVNENWQTMFNLFFGPLAYPYPGYEQPEILQAIGECGLDRQCTAPYDLQLLAFKAQIAESERRRLPLIIHCVRAIDDMLHLKKDTTQPWVWHGFRGKPQQMQQLLNHGFYISFGTRYNAESLALCPNDRLFVETDEEDINIKLLYEEIARCRNTSTEGLQRQVWNNANTLFDNIPSL